MNLPCLYRGVCHHLAILQSAEQTYDGVRYKEPKSGRARTVNLSPTVVV